MKAVSKWWEKCFLEERPSTALGIFRLAVAFTVGAHVIPTLLHMEDNYLSSAFKEKNLSFFTPGVIAWIDKSPDWLVLMMAKVFYISLVFFAAGFLSQFSCILMTLCCYYFYALNSLHIGTLSFDILLVTLFLVGMTGYPGDNLSFDCLIRYRSLLSPRQRPFFVQRLLQLQIASTYLYTGLCKIAAEGNWLDGNPLYYLYNSTSESVVKHFPLRSFLAHQPGLCHAIGIAVILGEFSMPFLLFIRKTRPWAVALGFFFHVLLLVTLHVPTIFFFLFPPQLLLFIFPRRNPGR